MPSSARIIYFYVAGYFQGARYARLRRFVASWSSTTRRFFSLPSNPEFLSELNVRSRWRVNQYEAL